MLVKRKKFSRIVSCRKLILLISLFYFTNRNSAQHKLHHVQRDPEPDRPHLARSRDRVLRPALHVLPGLQEVRLGRIRSAEWRLRKGRWKFTVFYLEYVSLAKLGCGEFNLGSSKFLILPQLPQKWRSLGKWSKMNRK